MIAKINLVVLILILATALPAVSRMVIRIDNPSEGVFEQHLSSGADIAAYHPGQYLDLVIAETDLPSYQALFPQLRVTQTEAALKANLTSSHRDIPGYRNYAQMYSELMNLQAQYPNLISVQSIGEGWGAQYAQSIPYYQGYDHQLWAVKLSNNVHEDEDEPAIYVVGTHHAREPISMEVSLHILTYLAENYGGFNPTVTNLLDNAQFWFVPLLNPDGHKVVIDQTDIWWRKNIRDNNNNQSFSTNDYYGYGSDGVDLNRNYSYEWGYLSSTDDTSYPTYHGPAAFSEPETQAFKTLLESLPFVAGLSYHTYGQYVLYPYGYATRMYAPDHQELQSLANAMAYQIGGQSGGFYTPMNAWELYPVSGGSDDWAYGELGIFGFTIEMATEFIPPAAEIPGILQNNLQGALTFFDRINRAMLKGHVTDAYTGEALEATVFVDGIDDHPVPKAISRSRLPWGSYYRFLSPGYHTLRIFKEGYEPVVQNVLISDTEPTQIDVALIPLETQGFYIKFLEDGNPQQPISQVSLAFENLDRQLYFSDQNGVISFPDLLPGFYNVSVTKPGFNTLCGWIELSNAYTFSLSQNPYLEDDFEINLDNWTLTGTWNRTNSQYTSGAYSLTDSPAGQYQNNVSSSARLSSPIDLTGAVSVNLQFKVMHSMTLDGDMAALEYSTNGSMWRTLDYFYGNSPWTHKSYNLDGLRNQNLQLRFTMTTNSSGRADGIYIDDLKLFVSYYEVVSNQENLASPIILKVYPNPAVNQLRIELEGTQSKPSSMDLEIFNIRGQLVGNRKELSLTNSKATIDLNQFRQDGSRLASGLYFLRLSAGGKHLAEKKIVITN